MSGRAKLLQTAEAAVTTFREASYGGPEDSFARIAKLWNAFLAERFLLSDKTLGPEDVALMMILLKSARLIQDISHYDSIVDIAGYAACLAEIVGGEQ